MLQRNAWKWLLVPTVIVILFGIGDVIRGVDADPAIVEGLTGLTIEEIEAASPEGVKVIEGLTRGQGLTLVWFGTALTAIVWFAYRRWQRWAWYTMWLLPVWSISVSIFFLLQDRPAEATIPPPLVSGFVFFAYAAFWLAVSYRGFASPTATAPE